MIFHDLSLWIIQLSCNHYIKKNKPQKIGFISFKHFFSSNSVREVKEYNIYSEKTVEVYLSIYLSVSPSLYFKIEHFRNRHYLKPLFETARTLQSFCSSNGTAKALQIDFVNMQCKKKLDSSLYNEIILKSICPSSFA